MVLPINPIDIPNVPTSQVTPFTHRDGMTYLQRIERIKKFLDLVVLPHINVSYKEIADNVNSNLNELVERFNSNLSGLTEEVENHLSENESMINQLVSNTNEEIENRLSENESKMDQLLSDVIGNSVELQDMVLETLINTESRSQTALNTATDMRFNRRGDAMLELALALSAGVNSFGVVAMGDSTTTPDTAWYRLLANAVAEAFPEYHHRYWKWNHSKQAHDRPIALTPEGTKRGLRIPAGSSSQRDGATIAGSAIVGDIDLRMLARLPSWTPGETQCVIHRWTDDSQRSCILYLTPTGALRFVWYSDGVTSAGDRTSNDIIPFTANQTGWIRVTLDVDNGAAGHDVKFYTSTDGENWTQLGGTITGAGTTSIYAGNSRWGWGRRGSNSLSEGAVVHEIQIRDGLNGATVCPILPEHWARSIGQYQPTIVGKPVVDWVLGAEPGAGLGHDYQTTGYLLAGDRPRLMALNVGQVITFFNSSHNDYQLRDKAFIDKYTSWMDRATADKPLTARVALTQNPRTGTAADPATEADFGHKARRSAILALSRRGVGVDAIDTYQEFLDDGRALGILISDGVHPSSDGYKVWLRPILEDLNAALKRVGAPTVAQPI